MKLKAPQPETVKTEESDADEIRKKATKAVLSESNLPRLFEMNLGSSVNLQSSARVKNQLIELNKSI